MCTRNGERFVARQVQSILSQRPAPAELVVGDDASSDATLDVIEREFAAAQSADLNLPTTLTVIRRSTPLGVAGNFAATMSACSGDLIALSDQDDEWLPGKLATLSEVFSADPELLLVHTDARLVDADGSPLGLSLLEALEITRSESAALTSGDALTALLRRNLVTGCTVMVRRSLLQSALPFPDEWVHDEWLGAIAASVGKVQLLRESLLDYRQHDTNQIGARRPTFADRFSRLRESRDVRAPRLAERAATLAARGRALGVSETRQAHLDAKAAHEAQRAQLPGTRLLRVPAVVRAAMAGTYHRYSRGIVDVVRDLVAPGGLPSGAHTPVADKNAPQ